MAFNRNYDRGRNPCRECKKRAIGCHSKCDDYKEFTKKIEKIREKEKQDNLVTDSGWGYIPRRKEK